MKVRFWAFLGLLFIVCGCAASTYAVYQPSPYDTKDPAFNRVPPSWYDYDPAMRHWYTFPYYVPERQN